MSVKCIGTNFLHEDITTRQTVTVMYLIDHLTLRADNQKDVNKEAEYHRLLFSSS